MTINKTISAAKNFAKNESYALAFSKFAATLAALAFTNFALAQDFGETVSAAMDAFREVRSQSAAPKNVKDIFAKASEAEEDGCMNFCGFYLGMSADDARTLAGYYSLKNDEWNDWIAPSSKKVYKFMFSLKGVRRITHGGNSFDELSQAVANRIGSMKARHNDDYDLIGYEYKNIDGQTALISEENGLVLEDSNLARKAAAEVMARKVAAEAEARKVAVEAEARKVAARKAAAEAEAQNLAKQIGHQKTDKVQLWEGGPYWATMNIGAEKPEDYGLYFWWGDTVGYKRKGGAWVARDGASQSFSFSEANTPTYDKDLQTLKNAGWTTLAGVLALDHDAAHVHWGGSWRMPTNEELNDLINYCDWVWTTLNGVNGYVVIGCGDYASNGIFLPAAGYGNKTTLSGAGSDGTYWSSVLDSGDYLPWCLSFGAHGRSTYRRHSYGGLSIRPVQGGLNN